MSVSPYLETVRAIYLPIRANYLKEGPNRLSRLVNAQTKPGESLNVLNRVRGGTIVFSKGWLDWVNLDYKTPLFQITGQHMHKEPLIFLTHDEAKYFTEMADPRLKPIIRDITRTYEVLAPIFTGLLSKLLTNYPYYVHQELTDAHRLGANIQHFEDEVGMDARLYIQSQDFYKTVLADQGRVRRNNVLQSILFNNQSHITIVDASLPDPIKQELRQKLG